MLLVLVIAAVVLGVRSRRRAGAGRESVDINMEYGAREYYQDEDTTNVVDENDIYRTDDNYADYSDYAAYDED